MQPPRVQQREEVHQHTLSKAVDRQPFMGVLGQILKRDLWLSLSNHQMDDNHALEHDSPRRVS